MLDQFLWGHSSRDCDISCFLIAAVHSDRVVLKNGGDVPCGMVVWSTGLAPRDFVTKLDIPKNNRGQVCHILMLWLLFFGSSVKNIFVM